MSTTMTDQVTPPATDAVTPPATDAVTPPATDAVTPPAEPLVYEFAKEANVSEDFSKKLTEYGNKHKISKEAMTELVSGLGKEFGESLTKAHKEATEKEWAGIREGWINEIKADKEFGGDKFNETANRARRAVKTFGDEGLVKFLDDTGYGDHSALIKAFARIDRMINKEANFHEGDASKTSGASIADVLFSDMFEKK